MNQQQKQDSSATQTSLIEEILKKQFLIDVGEKTYCLTVTPDELRQAFKDVSDRSMEGERERVKQLEPQIREILKTPLYGTSKCPYCNFIISTGRKVGMERHIRVKHPNKFTDKADRIINLLKG